MSILIAVKGWSPEEWVDAVKSVAPGRAVEAAGAVTDPDAVQYALVWGPERGALARYPNLRAIFSLGAGVDHLTSDPELPDVPVARIVDPDLTMRMTEWVVLQVLLHHRQHLAYARQQAARQWKSLRQAAASEVRVGVMGLGVLGRDAAEALKRLGFQVAGWSRSARDIPGLTTFHGEGGLEAFLAGTDILVVLLPLTDDTRGILDGRLIDSLAKDGPLGGPVLINAGRGKLQVEADIDAALRDGRLKGATLDVFSTEPLPAESPLWSAPNLVITPHVAADSDPIAVSRNVVRQIEAPGRGEPLEGLVDRSRGDWPTRSAVQLGGNLGGRGTWRPW
ncbi:2-hydroxyacid dehydrogenase [Chthonobacter albigriseus]|uniref:2-hydroxyacid dehydrogenase n=1 Tax=Chthonobacter albigriseus TaxID=1683161 RepID=UPI0019D644EA|nr:glyoxylate/hydroxypyruvate reductase A [Chthonobacter albigriseus]